ncbi:MAG: phospholipase A [Sulfurimonas sp.]|nr:phospholipase A [Sulfurimonas sp.]MDQ7060261.1 phospholipase A [Sulfurimonas sp.]
MRFNKLTFLILGLTISLFANEKLFLQILEEAKLDNKAAQYKLAEMYKQGRGTKLDYKEAMAWYKKAASEYAPVDKKELSTKADAPFLDRLSAQFDKDSLKDANRFEKGDFFGIKPYKVNYMLPISYSKNKPHRVSSIVPPNELIGTEYEKYNKNVEIEFQLSLQKELSYNLFGWNESINIAYTQKVFWQAYDNSAPFREANYQPEVFMTLPTSQNIDDSLGLKAIKLGFVHESNGQEGYRSRSWNRLYVTGMWKWDNLYLSTRAWYRIPEDKKADSYFNSGQSLDEIQAQSDGDDNPDIQKYLGYGDINIDYLYEKHQFSLMLRNNLNINENKGAIELNYAHPLFNSPYTSVYVKLFNGYGDSLIDYNVNVTKAAIGFSISNGLFY